MVTTALRAHLFMQRKPCFFPSSPLSRSSCSHPPAHRLLVATRSKNVLTNLSRRGKGHKQVAAARLNAIDAHDVLIDRSQPQLVFCVRFPDGSEGGAQNLYLEVQLRCYACLCLCVCMGTEEIVLYFGKMCVYIYIYIYRKWGVEREREREGRRRRRAT